MDLGLQGKTAIVTGASRGLGAAIAAYLAQEGADVCLVARDSAALEGVRDTIKDATGRTAHVIAADLRDPQAAEAVVSEAVGRFGRLNLLVNNAGAAKRGDFFTLTEADWDDGFSLKLRGYVRVVRAAWPHLKAGDGRIVNIIGVGARLPKGEFTIGGAINAGLLNFTKAMAEIGDRDGVRVMAVNPGRIETERLSANIARLAEMHGVSREDAAAGLLAELGVKRFGRPEEIAWAVAFALSDRAAYMQGSFVDVDGFELKTV